MRGSQVEGMKRLSHVWLLRGAAVCLLCLVSGCETVHEYSLSYKLWDNADFCKWSEPLPNPHLALFETPGHTNLLVEYDAFSERRAVIKRQAYYLQPGQAQSGAGKAPRFVSPGAAAGLKSIPVFEARTLITNPPAPFTSYAVLSESGREFTLYPQADASGVFQLPVYPEGSGTIKRVALTPVAAVGDTAMVGLAASFVALVMACEGGFSFTP